MTTFFLDDLESAQGSLESARARPSKHWADRAATGTINIVSA